jgi:hypothetical protein
MVPSPPKRRKIEITPPNHLEKHDAGDFETEPKKPRTEEVPVNVPQGETQIDIHLPSGLECDQVSVERFAKTPERPLAPVESEISPL